MLLMLPRRASASAFQHTMRPFGIEKWCGPVAQAVRAMLPAGYYPSWTDGQMTLLGRHSVASLGSSIMIILRRVVLAQ